MSLETHQAPSVALKSLSIRDFRGIKSLDLDFTGPDGLPNSLIVIGGPNGSGKTSVLEAAIYLLDETNTMMASEARRDIRREGNVRSGGDRFSIEGHLRDSLSGNLEIVRRVSSFSGERNPASSYVPLWYFPSWRGPGIGGSVDVTTGRTKTSAQKKDRNRLKRIKQKLVNAAAVEKFSESDPRSANQYSKWIESINRAWNEFDPSRNAGISVELIGPGNPDSGSFDLFYRQPDYPRLEVDLLSSGQLELLMLIAELVFNGERDGIVFIDEPELHLDPQWHRPFLRSLMRLQPKTQFIVTTHSTEIFDAARSYERHFLVPEDDPRARLWPEKRIRPVGV